MDKFKKVTSDFEKLPLKKLFVFSFLGSFSLFILGLIMHFFLPLYIPLFYGLPETSDQLAPRIFILIPAAISTIITLLNIVISVNNHDGYINKILAFASILILLLAAITTYKIFFLVNSF